MIYQVILLFICRISYLVDPFIWDLACLDNLTEKEQLKIDRIFISHTHMDHFMGIDSLIRFNLPHKRKLQFYGPKQICKRICNRLNFMFGI